MELTIAIIVIVIILVLPYGLMVKGYNENTKLTEENAQLKSRLEAMQERALTPSAHEEENLTAERVMEAIRFSGYVPEQNENWIRFLSQGEEFFIDIDRLPTIFIMRFYNVDPKEWEMDLLKQAAHLMSDELIMVKALFHEREDGSVGLRFLVVALDRDYYNLRSNLPRYISMIIDGDRRMKEIYNQFVKEKRDAAITINPFLPADSQENKVMS